MAATSEPERSRDNVTGAQVLTGEMLAWSDLDRVAAPHAVRVVVAELVRARAPRRVLLAGPRAAMLLDVVPTSTAVHVLVRSIPDSRGVSDDAGLHERASLRVGGLDAFDDDEGFDLVVALGGPARLLGPDSTGMGEAEVLAALAGLLTPTGSLVVDVTNELGMHELVAAQSWLDVDTDDDAWHVGARGFDDRHLHLTELRAACERLGLSTDTTFGAYPSPDGHHLLLDGAALVDGGAELTSAARLHGCHAVARHFGDTPALRDPRDTVERLVDAGLTTELAPAWLLVAHRGEAAAPLALPAIVDAETWVEPSWARVDTVGPDGATHSTWATGDVLPEVNSGAITRDLAPRRSPNGRILEMALRDACARRSHRDIRDLVQLYHAWLRDPKVWTRATAERRGFATTDNVVVGDEQTLEVVDPSWRRAGVLGADDMFHFGVRHFATRLLASASPHPWKTSTTPAQLTATLAGMAGVVVTEDDTARVVRVRSEMSSVITPDGRSVAELIEADLEQGELPRNLPSATASGFRELLALDRVRSRRMREHDGQVAWLEGTLRHRDRYIRELERIIERYEETLTWKTVQAIRAPRRIATQKAVSTAKATANEVLPPDFMSKARRFARRAIS